MKRIVLIGILYNPPFCIDNGEGFIIHFWEGGVR
jgi:hypothetical protein